MLFYVVIFTLNLHLYLFGSQMFWRNTDHWVFSLSGIRVSCTVLEVGIILGETPLPGVKNLFSQMTVRSYVTCKAHLRISSLSIFFFLTNLLTSCCLLIYRDWHLPPCLTAHVEQQWLLLRMQSLGKNHWIRSCFNKICSCSRFCHRLSILVEMSQDEPHNTHNA